MSKTNIKKEVPVKNQETLLLVVTTTMTILTFWVRLDLCSRDSQPENFTRWRRVMTSIYCILSILHIFYTSSSQSEAREPLQTRHAEECSLPKICLL
jgi:hypothetical protein